MPHVGWRVIPFDRYCLFAEPTVVGGELEFLLQAGELAVPDPTAAFIQDGDVLRPFLRQMDRRNPDKLKVPSASGSVLRPRDRFQRRTAG